MYTNKFVRMNLEEDFKSMARKSKKQVITENIFV